MSSECISFTVLGCPAPQGSMKAFVVKGRAEGGETVSFRSVSAFGFSLGFALFNLLMDQPIYAAAWAIAAALILGLSPKEQS